MPTKAERKGTNAGHKKDYLVRKARRDLSSEPGGRPLDSATQTGADPAQAPFRGKARYAVRAHAHGPRRHGVKESAHKGARRAERMLDRRLAGGYEIRDWHR